MCSLAVSTQDSPAVEPRLNPGSGKILARENLRLYTTSLVVMSTISIGPHNNIQYNTMQCKFRVANSHAYGVILTHLTCYSRTHAIDKFTHAFKRNHTHTHAIL